MIKWLDMVFYSKSPKCIDKRKMYIKVKSMVIFFVQSGVEVTCCLYICRYCYCIGVFNIKNNAMMSK